jgi:hydrogenase maturation protease
LKRLVIGIGNAFRCDDGVGLVVAHEITRLELPGVEVITSAGEPGAILEAWADADLAIVVDAASGGDDVKPGRVRCWAPGSASVCGAMSSHSFALGDVYALGRALDRAPQALVVVTVDAADLGMGSGLSASVAGAVPAAVAMVLDELEVEYR